MKKSGIEKKGLAVGESKVETLNDRSQRGVQELLEYSQKIGYNKDGLSTAQVLSYASVYKVKKIPTGIFLLDWYTHGGLPIDRITRVYGKENSGKTTLMFKLIANAQRFCRHCQGPIVTSPDDGKLDCNCPNPRYKLVDAKFLSFFPRSVVAKIEFGFLPDGAEKTSDGYRLKKDSKFLDFVVSPRCEPMRVVLVETEQKLDIRWAEKLGVNTDLVVAVQAAYAEETINKVEEWLNSDLVDFLAIDTLQAMVTYDSVVKGMDETKKVADKAITNQRFLEKIYAAKSAKGLTNPHPITVLINSQVRTQGLMSFRPSFKPSDGFAIKHGVALDICLSNKGYHFVNKEYASRGEFEFEIKKNHVGGPTGVSGSFHMWLDPLDESTLKVGETDDLKQVVDFGRKYGVISESNGSKYSFDTRFMKDKHFGANTIKELDVFLRSNRSIFMDLRQRVLDKVMNNERNEMKVKKGGGDASVPKQEELERELEEDQGREDTE